jgi:hypothetical protein
MKIKLLALSLLTIVSAQAVTITGFGTGQYTGFGSTSFATATQTASTLNLVGIDQNDIFGNVTPISIGSVSTLYLTASVSANPASTFDVVLFDAEFDTRTYTGNWSSFSTSLSEVALGLTSSVGVFGTVTGVQIFTGGTGSALNVTLDLLSTTSAIPEPSSFAALAGFAALGLVGLRRRRR